jgi:hypothetical protein
MALTAPGMEGLYHGTHYQGVKGLCHGTHCRRCEVAVPWNSPPQV